MDDRKQRGWLREAMPETAATVDAVRAAFCATAAESAALDRILAAGARGEPMNFHAVEGGRAIGAPFEFAQEFVYVNPDRWERRGCGA